MEDRRELIEQKYGFQVKNQYRARGAILFDTKDGPLLLREKMKLTGHFEWENEVKEHLRKNGIFVYLSLPYTVIARRVGNRATRGIAAENGETLKDIYEFRKPYYEKYDDFTVDCKGNSVEKNVAEILRVLIGIR